MLLGIGQKGNTIDKTTDILRKFRAEEEGPKQVSSDSQRDRFRLAALYGAGVKRIKDCRGRRQPMQKGDNRDFEVTAELAERNISRALHKLSSSALLSERGAKEIETLYPASRVSLFEVIRMFTTYYKVNLSREEAAALIVHWDCKTGVVAKPQVDYNKLLMRLSLLAEQARTEGRANQVVEIAQLKEKHQQLIKDKYTLQLNEVNTENTAQMEAYRAGAGLVQLCSALAKLNKGVKKAYKRDSKGFLGRVNITEKALSGPYSGDGGSSRLPVSACVCVCMCVCMYISVYVCEDGMSGLFDCLSTYQVYVSVRVHDFNPNHDSFADRIIFRNWRWIFVHPRHPRLLPSKLKRS